MQSRYNNNKLCAMSAADLRHDFNRVERNKVDWEAEHVYLQPIKAVEQQKRQKNIEKYTRY
jgi:hypothetical protein